MTALSAPSFASFFVQEKRGDGSSFLRLSDDAPRALRDAVEDCHDGELPNDWRYELALRCAMALAEQPEADLEEISFSVAEQMTEPYTSLLLSWFAEISSRLSFAEDAAEEGGLSSVSEALSVGQFRAAQEGGLLFLSSLLS